MAVFGYVRRAVLYADAMIFTAGLCKQSKSLLSIPHMMTYYMWPRYRLALMKASSREECGFNKPVTARMQYLGILEAASIIEGTLLAKARL